MIQSLIYALPDHNPNFDLPEEVKMLNNGEILSLLARSRAGLISVPQAVTAISAYERQWPTTNPTIYSLDTWG